jgi:two-component system, chemotaxis family, sensor kinase Cph1
VLAKLTAAALLGAPDLLDLVPADGVAVHIQGEHRVRGAVPAPEVVSAVADWGRDVGEEVASSEYLPGALPDLDLDPESAAGALALNLPDGQYVVWFRREVLRSVDWGGDPHNKTIAVNEGGDGRAVRLSPRTSFERWREIVHQRSQPWAPTETESAESLRRHLVESLYRRTRDTLLIAETLQRSLLPESIPTLERWQLSALYEAAAGGRLIVLLGDVAGHGITAAGTMAQLRNILRAQLFADSDPAEALKQLNDFCVHLLPRAFATVIVARVDLDSGQVEAASAGHLIPYLTSAAAAVQAPITLSPPIGLKRVTYTASTFTIDPGQGLVMYSDGLVERFGESIDDGIERLAANLGGAVDASASSIRTAMEWGDAHDDVTIVTLRRP